MVIISIINFASAWIGVWDCSVHLTLQRNFYARKKVCQHVFILHTLCYLHVSWDLKTGLVCVAQVMISNYLCY